MDPGIQHRSSGMAIRVGVSPGCTLCQSHNLVGLMLFALKYTIGS